MNEDALRALVRETIARMEGREPAVPAPPLHLSSHPSHYQYTLPPSDGPCFIEPGVRCNHCGYCQSHGH
ncbi:MAG TPA: hypothetical protein VL225_16785 [Vicinamibacterales bacterium]|nr:hypothetical protein [Vicinamibacterales bacterium]